MLGVDLDQSIGLDLADVAPEMAGLLDEAERRPDRLAQSQVQLVRRSSTRTLLVRIAAEHDDGDISGYVVTFDDITELLLGAAQGRLGRRRAPDRARDQEPADADPALRRAAEAGKYQKEIKNDPETFTICTDTIIRHVGDIGRMVDEFSAFARMPAPVIKPENLVEIVQRAVFLQRTADRDIAFETIFPEQSVTVNCDGRLVGQAVVNILKNAAEAIVARPGEGREVVPGHIRVSVAAAAGQATVTVEDNGKGLPGKIASG